MAEELSQVNLSGRQIRALAHPLRLRLLGELRMHGPATATQLAVGLATNTGATSYHLRQLAEVGLVLDIARPGGGRQRWWRAAHDMSSWRRSYYEGDPDATAAAEWLERHQVSRFAELAQAWRQAIPGEPAEWRDAGEISDYLLTLDVARVGSLLADLEVVIERYRAEAADDPRPGSRAISLYLAALPRVGPHGPVAGEGAAAGDAAEDGAREDT
ncbi:helix-turn-helix domain-containing protein [Actinoplanes sp. NPDC051851]|uniref:helix-turn-helix domain-containing protein n=1 Tax=Actinoplanes sp. NPDC051851 TaxID=3154753 RepID=UPI003423AED7